MKIDSFVSYILRKIEYFSIPATSQSIVSLTNFLISLNTIMIFPNQEFAIWFVLTNTWSLFQSFIRTTFLENSIINNIEVSSRSKISLLGGFFLIIGNSLVLAISRPGNLNEIFLGTTSLLLFLLQDISRYISLQLKSPKLLFADITFFAIQLGLLVYVYSHFKLSWSAFLLITIIGSSISLAILWENLLKISNNSKSSLPITLNEKTMMIVSSVNIICGACITYVMLNELSFKDLRNLRLLSTVLAPLSTLTLVLWLRNISMQFDSGTKNLKRSQFVYIQVFSLVFTLFIYVGLHNFVKYQNVGCLLFGVLTVATNFLNQRKIILLRKSNQNFRVLSLLTFPQIAVLILVLTSPSGFLFLNYFASLLFFSQVQSLLLHLTKTSGRQEYAS